MTEKMSKDCKYFVQHAWKQDLCANCFESREDHRRKLKQLNIYVSDFAANVKSILRQRDNNQKQRKNVVFRTSLTEIIGYGGDDLYDFTEYDSDHLDENDINKSNNNGEDDDDDDDDDGDEDNSEDNDGKNSELTDGARISKHTNLNNCEEDRALNNLTRSNTNFNRVTANLNEPSTSLSSLSNTEKITPKCFNNLMLGNIQKDSDGKKKTLLVSVTPFGASNNNACMISAVRSADKAPIHDEKMRATPDKVIERSIIEANCTSTSLSNYKSLKLNKTHEKKCQKRNESIITTNVIKSNTEEQINMKINVNELKCDDENVENLPQINSTVNTSIESVTPDIIDVAMNTEVTDTIVSVSNEENYESFLSDNRENHEINDLKFSDEKTFEDTCSNSSADSSTLNSSPELSIISPKPRNSFLHGGKITNDTENSLIKSDKVYELGKSTSCSNFSTNNISNIKNQVQTPNLPEKISEDLSNSIFTRKPISSIKSDCPVVREKEKRERATSCSPKFRKMEENSLNRNSNDEISEAMCKCCGTRSLSRHSSSSYSQVLSANVVDDEIKKKNKMRFSLKRLLRIGSSRKDLKITTDSFVEGINNMPSIPQFKNKPEIIHPLQLDGAAVEILYHDKLIKITDEITGIKSSNVKVTMREPPPPPPTNVCSSAKSHCHQLPTNKFTKHSLHDDHERTKLSKCDDDREHPSCHSISTTTSTVHSITADSIHTGIHNFGKFRPIQCN